MNQVTKKLIVGLLAVAGFITIMGVAGSYDYAEQVIYTMSDTVYQAVKKNLGEGASCIDIANEYMNNREYYDTLK